MMTSWPFKHQVNIEISILPEFFEEPVTFSTNLLLTIYIGSVYTKVEQPTLNSSCYFYK